MDKYTIYSWSYDGILLSNKNEGKYWSIQQYQWPKNIMLNERSLTHTKKKVHFMISPIKF